jgi:hypothetical protein
MRKMEFEIVSARKELYVDSVTDGHDCHFTDVPTQLTRWTFLLKSGLLSYEFTIATSYGECGSGWTIASYGEYSLRHCNHMTATHRLREKFVIDLNVEDVLSHAADKIECLLFSVSTDGGDQYYPSGGHTVNEDMLIPLKRGFNSPPVYVLYGVSGTGKSTLASQLAAETVYETDFSAELPDLTYYSAIVVGNKYPNHLQRVIELVKSAEIQRQIILVNFSFG